MTHRFTFLLIGIIGIVHGMAQAVEPIDPTGTWKWVVTSNNENIDVTLKLAYSDRGLVGKISGPNNAPKEIADGTFKDGVVAFTVTREIKGKKITARYWGRLEGDAIKGSVEIDRSGERQKRDWEAQR